MSSQIQLDINGLNTNLGAGYNIYGENNEQIFGDQCVGFSNNTRPHTINNTNYQIPDNVNVRFESTPSFEAKTNVSMSASKLQESLSVKAGVDGSYGGFNGSIKAAYGQESTTKNKTAFCEYSQELRAAYLELSQIQNNLNPSFATALNNLKGKTWDTNEEEFRDLFDTYGTHYIHGISWGAKCSHCVSIDENARMDEKNIELAVKASYSAVFSVNAEVDYKHKVEKTSFASNHRTKTLAYGGDAVAASTIAGKPTPENFTNWVKSTQEPNQLVDISFNLREISKLANDPSLKTNIQNALDKYKVEKRKPLPDEQMETKAIGKKIKVKITELYVYDDYDPGPESGELFGHFWIEAPDNNKFYLIRRDEGNNVDIWSGYSVPLHQLNADEIEFVLLNNWWNKSFTVKCWMTDDDTFGNDDYGSYEQTFHGPNFDGTKEHYFAIGNGEALRFKYKVEVEDITSMEQLKNIAIAKLI
jgi:hypothetical protein